MQYEQATTGKETAGDGNDGKNCCFEVDIRGSTELKSAGIIYDFIREIVPASLWSRTH
jgi:hypothetical protein